MTGKTRPPSPHIPSGLIPEGDYGRVTIRHCDVPDPFPNPDGPPGQLIRAARNINRDVLEFEHGHGRLSDEAYLQGRILQQALEIAGGSGQAQWSEGDKVDAGSLVELAIVRKVDRARFAVAVIRHCHVELGKRQGAHVVLCLRDPQRWRDIAARYGEAGPKAEAFYARLFRDGLEHLATAPIP